MGSAGSRGLPGRGQGQGWPGTELRCRGNSQGWRPLCSGLQAEVAVVLGLLWFSLNPLHNSLYSTHSLSFNFLGSPFWDHQRVTTSEEERAGGKVNVWSRPVRTERGVGGWLSLNAVTSPLWASVCLTWSKNMGFNHLKSASGTKHFLFISVYCLSKPPGQLEQVQPQIHICRFLCPTSSPPSSISSFLGGQREWSLITFSSQLKGADPTSCFHSGWSHDPGLAN